LELGFFILGCFPLASADELREEAFALAYGSRGGIPYADIARMDRVDRHWYLRRLSEQKEAEEKAIRKA
jgi:hypothetical protein